MGEGNGESMVEGEGKGIGEGLGEGTPACTVCHTSWTWTQLGISPRHKPSLGLRARLYPEKPDQVEYDELVVVVAERFDQCELKYWLTTQT